MNKARYIIPIFVPHKGCPHDCVFCNQKKITGQEQETTAFDVTNKIDTFLETIPSADAFVEVAFYGGSFTAIPIDLQTELLSAAYPFVSDGRIQCIRVSTRPDCINEKILENLKAFGVKIVELGVQSLDDEVLVQSHRGHTSEAVYSAIQLLKEYGFTVGVQIMVGLPGDTNEKCITTTRQLAALEPDIARIYPALVIRNTHMEESYLRGCYTPLTVLEAAEICKDMVLILRSKHVEVIRIGLQPTENIALGKDVIAGPFHPAMRQIVESLIYRDMIDSLLSDIEIQGKELTITVHPKDISCVLGQKKSNIIYIKNKYSFDKIFVLQDSDIEKGRILLKFDERLLMLSTKDYCGSTVI